MASNDGKVVDIGQAVKDAQREVLSGVPTDMSKLAIWRKGLPAPTTFVVHEEVGRHVQESWRANQWSDREVIEFETYSDGSGRKSTTLMRVDEVVGLTLEYATVALYGG